MARAIASGGIAILSKGGGQLGFYLRVCDSFHKGGLNEARRNDRYAQLIASLLAQTLEMARTAKTARRLGY